MAAAACVADVLVDVAEGHPGALAGEPFDGGPADPARTTGDEDDVAGRSGPPQASGGGAEGTVAATAGLTVSGRAAADAGVDHEEGAGQRLGGPLGLVELVPRGRDEQRREVRSAERRARHVHHREAHGRHERPVRVVAADGAAAVQAEPHAAVGVEREAVGEAVGRIDLHEDPTVGHRPGRQVVAVDVDLLGRRVDVVHPAPVEVPVEPVAHGHPAGHRAQAVGIQAVERRHARRPGERHRAEPQPPGRVGLALVDAVAGPVGLDGQPPGRLTVGGDQRDVAPGAAEQLRTVTDRDGEADRRRHRHRSVVAGRGVEVVDDPAVDVDVAQPAAGDVPVRALAELAPTRERRVDGGHT